MGVIRVPPERDEAKFHASPEDEPTVRQFHDLWREHSYRTWHNTHWMGVQAVKCPLDMWVYQEILHERRPDVVVETGTYRGGSAFFMATIFDMLGHGRIVTVDIEGHDVPEHPRITYIVADSRAPETLARVKESIGEDEQVMLILDSGHNRNIVLEEMHLYGPLVTEGQYLIVEDTQINLHVPQPKRGPYARPGPLQAVWDYLGEHGDRFVIDRAKEKFFMTTNPSGYLRCVAPREAGVLAGS